MPGTLFVVATPIGNLEDLTFRALRVLREVDLIAAEDTRRTSKLLAHYEIRKPLISLREHNETRETPRLLARLASGQSIALVSDAGTPAIADPGARLVRATREQGHTIVPIPGANAIATALSIAGLPADQFTFLGFPPSSGSAREAWLDQFASEPRTVVFFEAPHRISRTIAELQQLLVERPIMIARELTKTFEQLVLLPNIAGGSVPLVIDPRGEFVVVVGQAHEIPENDINPGEIVSLFGRLTEFGLFSEDEVTSLVRSRFGIEGRLVKKLVKKAKILAKQQKLPAS